MSDNHRINSEQNYRLMEFIKTNYPALNKGDPEFARIAAEALQFHVSHQMVEKRRVMLGMKSTRTVNEERHAAERAQAKAALAERKAALAARKAAIAVAVRAANHAQPQAQAQGAAALPASTVLERLANLERAVIALLARVENMESKQRNNAELELLSLPVYDDETLPSAAQ